jgi:GTP-binding protein
MFVDEVDIHVQAGDGGNGCLAFRREKFVPRGGPSGGDGGGGGSVYLVASPHQNTLVSYRFHPEFKAQRGGHGEGANCTGSDGQDLVLEVPPGTVAYELIGDEPVPLADLTEVGAKVLIARGGRGGRGNAAFATSTNRAPRHTEPGQAGETRQLRLRLKLLADVGLVGFPNAGKSTLISRISAARPKIADYPFTTLTPNLGVVKLSDDRSFVVADVPGLIAGAHLGHGLGTRFLAHLERTKVLVHMIDVSSTGRDPVDDFEVIAQELQLFAGEPGDSGLSLADKPRIAAANKIDALDEPARLANLKAHLDRLGVPLYPISCATGEGLPPLLEAMWREVDRNRLLIPPEAGELSERLKR